MGRGQGGATTKRQGAIPLPATDVIPSFSERHWVPDRSNELSESKHQAVGSDGSYSVSTVFYHSWQQVEEEHKRLNSIDNITSILHMEISSARLSSPSGGQVSSGGQYGQSAARTDFQKGFIPDTVGYRETRTNCISRFQHHTMSDCVRS